LKYQLKQQGACIVSTKPPHVHYKNLKVHAGASTSASVKSENKLRFADLMLRRNALAVSLRANAQGAGNSLQQADEPQALSDEDQYSDQSPDELDETQQELLVEFDDLPLIAPPQVEEEQDTEVEPQEEVVPLTAEPPLINPVQEVIPLTPDDPREMNVTRYLSDTVSRFCNDNAVGAGEEGWHVRIKVRPDVLNRTTMNLSLNPHSLQIRFDIQDIQARGLVQRHQKSLEMMLNRSVVPRREVSITFD
jgi:type III secretion control protein HpaP